MEGNAIIRDLLVKYANGELSDNEKSVLLQWAAASPANEELLQNFSHFDTAAKEMAEMDADCEIVWNETVAQIPDWKVKRMPLWGRLAVAASIIVTVVTAAYFFYTTPSVSNPSTTIAVDQPNPTIPNRSILIKSDGRTVSIDSLSVGTTMLDGGAKIVKSQSGELMYLPGNSSTTEVAYNTISVPAGSTQVVRLPDQSVVYLNALSSLYFPTSFQGQIFRTVRLSGEAYFEVAHNAAQKFNVQIDSMTLTVLGTEFNINGYNDESILRTTLFTGSIRVTQKAFAVNLVPGEQLQFNRQSNDIKIIRDADLEATAAWKNGVFSLDGVELGVLLRQIGRWHNLEVVFPYGEPKGQLAGEIAKETSLNDLVKVLQANNINVRLDQGKLIVLK